MKERSKEFQAGYNVRLEGPVEKAPYTYGTEEHRDWWAGVHQAEGDLSAEAIPNVMDEEPITEENPFDSEELPEIEEPDPEALLSTIKTWLVAVAEARTIQADIGRSLAEAKAALDASVQYAIWNQAKEALSERKAITKQAEADVKALLVEYYELTGNKKPTEEAYIKEYTIIDYDAGEALAYAKEHLTAAVIPEKLNKRAFEKVAKVVSLDFVTESKEPHGTIASKLGHLLED
jgi:hypothetical protein